ncbi:MAG: phosphoribosylaminoimidazolecarboxamide formyltransferase [Lachnospiraceae bacterium]|nr:phosphoribosylaminoimidazolecarboxamide formyltransferase [Lachnospiraceae bacterium]
MNELSLKYGCNPNQKPSRVFVKDGDLPIKVLNGKPGYINLLDALNGWQLVRELREVAQLPAAASFKHVSPAGAAVGTALTEMEKKIYWVDEPAGGTPGGAGKGAGRPAASSADGADSGGDLGTPGGAGKGAGRPAASSADGADSGGGLSPLACAYARARGADRMSSFGDFVALSDVCDADTAKLLRWEVSDGVIAPGYAPEALAILREKKNGNYNVVEIDPYYVPEQLERKQVFGVVFEQGRNDMKIDRSLLSNVVTRAKELPEPAVLDLLISLITLKYTQSNSVCYVKGGQAIGIGAGQQSRIHCTRLAGQKADNWYLRQSPQVLGLPFLDGIKRADRDNAIDVYIGDESEDLLADGAWQLVFARRPEAFAREEKKAWLRGMSGVSLGSDAFFPFGDNIERAHKSGVGYIAQPGGSVRDAQVIETCDKYAIAMAFTGLRLFHH